MTTHTPCSRTAQRLPERPALGRPKTLNLQAIDICNSRCVMCNIWQDGRREQMTLDELRQRLAHPFFSEVTHVGVTGGEPTLRKDLADLYQLLPQCLPKLAGASFITHGMQTKRAVQFYTEIHGQYGRLKLAFDGMVSLDGVGDVHDQVRGRKGAFASATQTLLALKTHGVPVIAACTIVRSNVYGLHDLLDWGKANGVYVRFRVAEFIRRLYNDSCAPEIRTFDQRELRHLVSFFHLLLTEYETNETIQKTYRSILSLLTGGERLIGCPYQRGVAVNVDSRGWLGCCAPKSSAFEMASDEAVVHFKLADQREEVTQAHCANCIHDYHDDWNAAALQEVTQARARSRELYEVPDETLTTLETEAHSLELASLKQVLLAGWYGTETAGDVAILQGVITEYLQGNPQLHFQVLSLYPYYTRTTIAAWREELRSRIRIVDYTSEDAWQATLDCDAVVMAGGPLMDIHETWKILCLFKRFADLGKPRVIEGCGIGPLNRADYRWNVCRIARLATRISVRDRASREALRAIGIRKDITVRPDPATTFIRAQRIRHHGSEAKVIRCFLRELTFEYPQSLTPDQAAEVLTTLLRQLLDWYPEHRIELWAMHHFPVGFDDRLFARQLVRQIANPRLTCDWEPRSPREILEAMAAADFCVCMRFHSCVFATEIGAPFLAIDYTAGGKIKGFLDDVQQQHRLCELADLTDIKREQFESKVRGDRPAEVHLEVSSESKSPRILHIIQSVTGGGGARAMIALAKHSRRSGNYEHHAVSLTSADEIGLKLADQAGLPILNLSSHGELCKAMAEADLVLVHWWNNPELAALFRRELPPMRLALWLHVGGYHSPQVLTPALIDFADLAVACSPHTYAHPVFANLPVKTREHRTAMALAGADFDRLQGLTLWAHEGFRIGYIGTLDLVKMHSEFVAMSCAVRAPEAKFVVCGGGDSRWLADEAEKLGRSASFDFKGHVEDIRSVIETFDVYGYPLCADTYAAAELNLQEVMFAGIPVVAFPHGGIGKLVHHNETGLLVETPEAYARAIEYLYQNPAERARLGTNAANFARKFWGAENAGREFNVHFERLLARPKRERQWGVSPNVSLSELSDFALDLAIHPGARMFLESLADGAQPFLDSLTSPRLQDVLTAEERIASLPRLMHYTGVLSYRNAHTKDPFLQLWAGLGFLHAGKAGDALGAFALAQQNGFTHWRVHWYRALAAELAGESAEAVHALDLVVEAAPNFTPALDMLSELGFAKPLAVVAPPTALPEAARGCVQQAERFLQQGKLADAREWLGRALDLATDQPDLIEALREVDFQLRNLDSAQPIGVDSTGNLPVASDCRSDRTAKRFVLETCGQKDSGVFFLPSQGAPLVSALVSTYASEKYLRACLEDLEAQTIADKIEIIVIDSGSPENERAIVEQFQQRYSNIRYVRTERETLYAAWNRGVQLARGQFITNANSDDAHRADALELLVAALEAHPEASLAYGDYFNSSTPNDSFAAPHITRRVVQPDFHPAETMFYCPTGCHPMWRRKAFDIAGLFDPSFTAPGDYEFLLRFIQAGLRAVHVPECLSLFFQNPHGLSWKSGQKSQHEWAVIQAKYRAEIPIERLFRVDPTDARSKAQGWVAFGNKAMNFRVPWFENSSFDLEFALICYETALKSDPENPAALYNLAVARVLKGNVLEGESLTRRLPPEHFKKLAADIKRGRLELVEVDVAPAAPPLTYSRADLVGTKARKPAAPSNQAPERTMQMPVRWVAPFHSPGDYSSDATGLVLGLNDLVDLTTHDQTEVYSESYAAGLSSFVKSVLETTGRKFNFVLGGIAVSERMPSQFALPRGAKFNIGRTTIESDRLPLNSARACNQMDEIWVPSQFALDAFAKSGVERDKLMLVPVSVDAAAFHPDVAPLLLPGRAAWNYLSVCEWNERAGWEVLLAAYLREFSASDDVCLHILAHLPGKTTVESKIKIQEVIRNHIATLHPGNKPWPRIEVFDLARADLPRLYRAVDCVVVPTRGEGWGRVTLEAMWMGLPVIATDWGAHKDFATEINAYPLKYELMEIRATEPELLHLRGLHWANPSEGHLRELLRRVRQDPAEAREKGSRARADILERFSPMTVADQVVRRLQAIEQKLTVPSCPATITRISNPVPEVPDQKRPPIHVAWEGTFLDLGSLSHVNREITRELANEPGIKLARVGKNILAPNLIPWPGMQETARRLVALPAKQTQVTVRHGWPPSWESPAEGAWVLIQPWEYGALPLDWCKQLARVDEVWAPSEYVRRVYVDSGVDPFKVKVVPNGIDPERFQPSAPPLKLATDKSFKFLFVGGTIHRKGPDLLLKAFLESFTGADDVCLVIKDFGGQSVYAGQTFEAQIKAAQSQPNAPEILYLHEELPPEALPGLYTACDCLVHPYRGEGFGLPVLEAMACGLPVVVTGGGATDDFATDEFAYRLPALRKEFCESISGMKLVRPGWLLEPDANALAERLKWIVSHRAEARAKGKAASDHVRCEWTWSRAAKIAGQHLQRLVTSREAASITPPRRAPKELTLPPVAMFGNLAAAREMLGQGQILFAWTETISALSVRPYHPEAFLLLAGIARAAGDDARAKALAEHARKLAPKWKPAQQFLKSRASKCVTKVGLPPLADLLLTPRVSRLTVCLITKNEERFLGPCLESVRDIARQIIVMDTGSTDRTVEIARQHGAEVFSFAWCDDFSAARNAALERANGDWILVLDADEELPPAQHEKLRKLMQDSSAMAFRLPMIDEGRQDEGVSYLPRLFRNAPRLFFMGCIHEHVFLSVEARRQEWGLENKLGDATLLHHGYTAELMKSRDKGARNLKLLQKALGATPDDPNLLMNLGLELARAGRLPDGIEQYDAAFHALSALLAAELVPEFCETLLTQFCTHLVTAKDYAGVARVLRSPLARANRLTATLHWLFGIACIESKNFAEGAEQMRQCLARRNKPALSPVNRNILKGGPNHCLALCLIALKQQDAAAQAFRAALKDEPSARPVRLDYARFLAESGQEVEALNALHQLMAEDPSDIPAWHLGGRVALSKPEFLEFACDWTSEAMKSHADQPAIVEQRAAALLLSGNAEAALPLWQQLDSVANPSYRAAILLCETLLDQQPDARSANLAGPVNQAFVAWYRRLLSVGASQVIEALNQRMELLRPFVPEAIRLLEAALAETNGAPAK